MQTKVIIIVGKKQAGKDSAAHHLLYLFDSDGYSSKKYAFADTLKDMCLELFDIRYEQVYGTDEEKNTIIPIKWENLPLPKAALSNIMHNTGRLPKLTDYMTGREFLQVLGTNIFRNIDNDIWARATLNKIKQEKMNYAIISDCRFPNEIDIFKEYKPIVIRLLRQPFEDKHESERALDDYTFSSIKQYYAIDNRNMDIKSKNRVLHDIYKILITNN